VLTKRCFLSNAVVLPALLDGRRMAARFLAEQVDVEPRAASHLQAAGEAYKAEEAVLGEAFERMPLNCAPEARRLEMAERPLRQFLADHLHQAKDMDHRAIQCLERALALV
jgi:hypothetical protein